MNSHLLQETADALLQETGEYILLETTSVAISAFDYTNVVMLDAFSLTECANRGEVGTGGFDVFDAASALSIPALKSVRFTEPEAVGNERIFTGYTHTRSTSYVLDADLAARSWSVETTDLNVLASDYVLAAADAADRSAETDYTRIVWLLTTRFGSEAGVGSGVVPNSNTVTMEATDYRGRKPADVLAECSEASGKLWFIYDYGDGPKLYYDLATGTSLSSTAKISDVDADTDGTTVFAPVGNVSVKRNPDRIYSAIRLTYNGGTVTVYHGATATLFRTREAAISDMSIGDATLATAKANALLAGAGDELLEVEGVAFVASAPYVNDIRQGQRVQIKLTRQGIAAYTYFRVIRRTVTPLGIDTYLVSLGLASDVLASANGGRGADDIPQNRSNANDDGATVIVDRGGITVTDGAITVTNGSAVVIIDGSSNMFKIAATGTLTDSLTGSTDNFVSTTLSGLGALSSPGLVLPVLSFSSVSAADAALATTLRNLGNVAPGAGGEYFVASISGGSPTSRMAFLNQAAQATIFTYLDGSSYQVVKMLSALNTAASTYYFYGRYYVLKETAL